MNRSGFVSVEGGGIYYELAGEGADRLVMIHGAVLDSRMWGPQFETFAAASYSVLRYDVRRHGRSTNDGRRFLFIDDLDVVLDTLEFAPAHLIGSGGGSSIAVDYALRRPESVSSLVLAPPRATGNQWSADLIDQHAEFNAALTAGDYGRVVDERLRLWIDGPRRSPTDVDSEFRATVRGLMLDNYPSMVADRDMGDKALDGPPKPPPAIDRLEEIQVPTLLVVGDEDQPEALELARLMNDRIPLAELRVVAGSCSTVVTLERSEEFNALLFDFLDAVKLSKWA